LLRSVAAYQRQVDACLGHDLLGVLPLLRTPTLVLVGEGDILTPPRYARALAASLAAAEVVVGPATGHACFLETPKAVADRMLRFLTARGSVREPAPRRRRPRRPPAPGPPRPPAAARSGPPGD